MTLFCPVCGIDHREGTRHRVSFAQQQERARASRQRSSARLRTWELGQAALGVPADAEAVEYAAVLFRDPCSYCGTYTNPPSIDHITARARGGQTRTDNLTAACIACNNRKHALPLLKGFARIVHHLVSTRTVQS